MKPVKKSDWKHFRASLVEWRERYLERTNYEIAAILTASGQTPTERFWAAHDRAKEESRLLRDGFDDYSKSNMRLHLIQMYNNGIFLAEDFGGFSEDLQADLRRWISPDGSGESA